MPTLASCLAKIGLRGFQVWATKGYLEKKKKKNSELLSKLSKYFEIVGDALSSLH